MISYEKVLGMIRKRKSLLHKKKDEICRAYHERIIRVATLACPGGND